MSHARRAHHQAHSLSFFFSFVPWSFAFRANLFPLPGGHHPRDAIAAILRGPSPLVIAVVVITVVVVLVVVVVVINQVMARYGVSR
jgi:hypothetical protein